MGEGAAAQILGRVASFMMPSQVRNVQQELTLNKALGAVAHITAGCAAAHMGQPKLLILR